MEETPFEVSSKTGQKCDMPSLSGPNFTHYSVGLVCNGIIRRAANPLAGEFGTWRDDSCHSDVHNIRHSVVEKA